jgi:hypothetical protein
MLPITPVNRMRNVLSSALAALLVSAPLIAGASVIGVSDPTYVGSTLNGTYTDSINLSALIPNFTALDHLTSATLTVDFTNGGTVDNSSSSYSCCGGFYLVHDITSTYVNPAVVEVKGVDGATATAITPYTSSGNTTSIQQGATFTDTTVNGYSVPGTVTFTLDGAELNAIDLTGVFDFNLLASESPIVTSETFSGTYTRGGSVPAPTSSLGLLALGVLGLVAGRRAKTSARA